MKSKRNINNELTGQIITLVCDTWGVTRPDLVGHSRRRPLPWARSMLCKYLQVYAGHDAVSTAAILHMSPRGVQCYNERFIYNARIYLAFRDKDDALRAAIKSLTSPSSPQ